MPSLIGITEDTVVNSKTARLFLETLMNTLNEKRQEYGETVSPLPLVAQEISLLPADAKVVLSFTERMINNLRLILSHDDIVARLNIVQSDAIQDLMAKDVSPDMITKASGIFGKLYAATPIRSDQADLDHIAVMEEFTSAFVTFPIEMNPRFFMAAIHNIDRHVDPQLVKGFATKAQSQFLELFADTMEDTKTKVYAELKKSLNAGFPSAGIRLN